jgi:beta-carotene hydroxylase
VRTRVVRELAFNLLTHALLVAALLWAGEIGVLVFAWLLPLLWLACVFNPISRGYEHCPMASLAADDPRRRDLRFNTVSVTSRLMGALWANIGLHVEHHMYPRVPFYRLPALHRLFAGKSYQSTPWPLFGLAHLSAKGEQS